MEILQRPGVLRAQVDPLDGALAADVGRTRRMGLAVVEGADPEELERRLADVVRWFREQAEVCLSGGAMNEIREQILTVLAKVVHDESGELPGTLGLTEAGLDSLSLLQLLVRLEGEFSTRFSDNEVFTAGLTTVDDLVEFVSRHVAAQR
jgi:acyl carrier protein